MKKLVVLLFLLTAFTSAFAQVQQKIGYVDTQIILTQYPAAIKASSDLENLAIRWRASIDSMTVEIQTDYDSYQKQQATMTPEKQREIQQQLLVKDQRLQQFNQQKFGQGGELALKQEELMAPIREKIYAAIEAVGESEGMQFVFDKAGDVLLLYADPNYDLTFKVLDKLKTQK